MVDAVRSLPPAVGSQSAGDHSGPATRSANELNSNGAAAAVQDQALLAWLAAALRADGSRGASLDPPSDLVAESSSVAESQASGVDIVWQQLR